MGASLSAHFSGAVQRCVVEFSKAPHIFDGLRWGLEGGFRRHHQLIETNFPDASVRVLDCGCGTGIFAKHFSPSNYVGIDISDIYLKHARKRNPNYRFERMDATELKFSSESFDAVITSGVIHHLRDEQARVVLSELGRVLKRSGFLLVWEDIPTRQRFNAIGRAVHRFDLGDFIRTKSEYASLLDEAFVVDSSKCFCSGFMDYAAFRCRPKGTGADEPI